MTDETTTPPPTALRVAAGVWLALAFFGVLTMVILWFRRADLARANDLSAEQVTGVLIPVMIVTVTFSAAYVLLTRQLRRGRRWARAVLSGVAVAHLLWLMLVGLSAASLVTALLLVAGIAFTWSSSTAQWLTEVAR